ncbi:MAG: hypothetical protein CFE32_14425 [Alphaproteobacteria bacterium PA3]|nr:MAG: hypothetical protein CFE32_14425 [Alphaproteobacteria bacterium PA3]
MSWPVTKRFGAAGLVFEEPTGLKGQLSPTTPPKQTNRIREGFRMLLGVRKCPENESLLLMAVAMGISVGVLVCWGPLERGLAGRRLMLGHFVAFEGGRAWCLGS